jgi:hypothetical protein
MRARYRMLDINKLSSRHVVVVVVVVDDDDDDVNVPVLEVLAR